MVWLGDSLCFWLGLWAFLCSYCLALFLTMKLAAFLFDFDS